DAYGVRAILPRPEGRGLPRTGSIPMMAVSRPAPDPPGGDYVGAWLPSRVSPDLRARLAWRFSCSVRCAFFFPCLRESWLFMAMSLCVEGPFQHSSTRLSHWYRSTFHPTLRTLAPRSCRALMCTDGPGDMSMLEIRHLRTLDRLRETDTLVEAAERLHLTQSALAHQFKELEERLGMPLFVRKTKPVRFTSAGLRILQLADQVLPQLRSTERDLARLAGGTAGRLHMAIECH